jgi:hypothetical protein
LVVWYGTSVFHSPPDDDKYEQALNEISEQEVEAEDIPAKRRELLKQRHALQEKREAEQEAYNRTVFWVACPLGLAALLLGSALTIQSLGSALMFGGLATLTAGCYSYWDKMDSWLRFGSLLVALAVVVGIGLWRFRPAADRPLVSTRG